MRAPSRSWRATLQQVQERQEITERLEELETLLEQRKGERRYGA
jgi:hypothetical protein